MKVRDLRIGARTELDSGTCIPDKIHFDNSKKVCHFDNRGLNQSRMFKKKFAILITIPDKAKLRGTMIRHLNRKHPEILKEQTSWKDLRKFTKTK